jgi:hypothetical protein
MEIMCNYSLAILGLALPLLYIWGHSLGIPEPTRLMTIYRILIKPKENEKLIRSEIIMLDNNARPQENYNTTNKNNRIE